MPDLVMIVGNRPGIESVPATVRHSASAWLATDSRASHMLRAMQTPVFIPEDLVSPGEVEAACVDAFEKLRSVCQRLDALLSAEARQNFLCALFDLGRHVDGAVWRAMVLERLRLRFPGCVLSAFAPGPEHGTKEMFVVTRPDQLWSVVLADMEWAAEVTWLPAPTQNPISTRGSKLRRLLRGNPWLWSVLQSWRLGLRRNLVRFVDSGRPAVLMLKAPYDWMPILQWAEREQLRIIFDEPERYFAEAVTPLTLEGDTAREVDAAWIGFCQKLPIPARAPARALLPDVRRLIAEAPVAAQSARMAAARTGKKFHVAAVLNAIGSDMRTQTVLNAYRGLGVTVLKWQHGSVWRHKRITQRMDESDLATADTHLSYGPITREAYLAGGLHEHCRVLTAGSSRLEALYHRAERTARPAQSPPRTILYTATNCYGDYWYCGFSPPFMDGTYYRDQVVLIQQLRSLIISDPGLQLTVKLPPRFDHDAPPPWVGELLGLPACRVITDEETHAELLLVHDAVIVDCATTTLLETLCTDRAVYVLLRAPAWPKEEVEHLSRRAICADNPLELLEALKRHIRTGEYRADRNDEVFLRRHGLVERSTKAAEATLRDVLGKSGSTLSAECSSVPAN